MVWEYCCIPKTHSYKVTSYIRDSCWLINLQPQSYIETTGQLFAEQCIAIELHSYNLFQGQCWQSIVQSLGYIVTKFIRDCCWPGNLQHIVTQLHSFFGRASLRHSICLSLHSYIVTRWRATSSPPGSFFCLFWKVIVFSFHVVRILKITLNFQSYTLHRIAKIRTKFQNYT